MKGRSLWVLKLGVVVALLLWCAAIFVLFKYWERLPWWAIGGLLLYMLVVGNDARIFKLPFMSREQLDKLFG